MKISVCIPVYNGEIYIKEQLESILSQLESTDEIVISDNDSSDHTLEIVRSLGDPRIQIFHQPQKNHPYKYYNLIKNVENALHNATGDLIFLSDQDDIWLPDKVEVMKKGWRSSEANLVLANAKIIDRNGNDTGYLFFDTIPVINKELWRSWMINPYCGCMLCFDRKVLKMALPFPENIAMHDIWIGLIAQSFGKCLYLNLPLTSYRRHGGNASTAAEKSTLSLFFKLRYRLYFLRELIKRGASLKKQGLL